MSWLMATLYDRSLLAAEEAGLSQWRAELLQGLRGEVLEVGSGTGLNLPHYPNTVTRLTITEPDGYMMEKLKKKGTPLAIPRVEFSDASLERLPMENESFDAVVATLVLCSVPEQQAALKEIYRVLRPGGHYAFIEHVAAIDRPGRLKWQRRLEPIWKRIAGNCHLTRQTADAIVSAGFEIEWIKYESIRKMIPLVRPSIRGIARKPA
jgi:ubiquinone/menaquinone biosynthesis C-methylase UbiE